MIIEQGPFSLVFQFTQECPFSCDICHRNYVKGQTRLNPEEQKQMIDVLKDHGLKRLTVSGGEPMILDEELFDLLKYIHQKQIHVCLSTTGYKLNKTRIEEMDGYIDQLLLSIRSLTLTGWQTDFGDTLHTKKWFETVINLLQWLKTTGIILEVDTVVHRENIKQIVDLGWQLASLNPNIIWRVDDYYGMGIHGDLRSHFELEAEEFEQVHSQIIQTFGHLFKHLHFTRRQDRAKAPDFLILSNGNLILTANYQHTITSYNVLTPPLPAEFRTRRPWSDYRHVCRDWGWGDL